MLLVSVGLAAANFFVSVVRIQVAALRSAFTACVLEALNTRARTEARRRPRVETADGKQNTARSRSAEHGWRATVTGGRTGAGRSVTRPPSRSAGIVDRRPAALRRARPGAQSRSAVGHSVALGHSVGRYQLAAARRRTRPRFASSVTRYRVPCRPLTGSRPPGHASSNVAVAAVPIVRASPSAASVVRYQLSLSRSCAVARGRDRRPPLSAVGHSVAVPIVRRRARPRPTSPAISCWRALCASRQGGRRWRRGEWRWWRR